MNIINRIKDKYQAKYLLEFAEWLHKEETESCGCNDLNYATQCRSAKRLLGYFAEQTRTETIWKAVITASPTCKENDAYITPPKRDRTTRDSGHKNIKSSRRPG